MVLKKVTGQQVAYLRVSTILQNTTRQLFGMTFDRVFEDKASGKSTDRPQLAACLSHLRDGDCLHVHSLDRLCRNLDDLRRVIKDLTGRGVEVKFHKEGLHFTGETSPMQQLLVSLIGAYAEFERSIILERQLEGVQIAKAKGVYKGRKPSLTPDRVQDLRLRAANGEKKTALAREFGISRETVYAYLGNSKLPQIAANEGSVAQPLLAA